MADNITDNSSSQDTSVQLGNKSVEVDQQVEVFREVVKRAEAAIARLEFLKKRDAPITDEPCPKRNREVPDELGMLARYIAEQEKKLATASRGSDDPPRGSDDPPQSGTEFGKYMHQCIANYIRLRQDPENPSPAIFGAVNNELTETILRYIGCGFVGNVENEFYLEYSIDAKIDSGSKKECQ
eukprot:GEMP01124450.1.p1 GENE.GEMP01124450.1~~GEMP01124450.1.p1  ORF type:complete len:183 (+),score=26.10 GEMP01124450.1:3-551(+)